MVKRGAGNGRGHVVLPIPFRTNSSFFALLHCRLRYGAANSRSGTTNVPGESQPAYSPNI